MMDESVEYSSLEIEFTGPDHASVAWLWLNRPVQRNAIDRSLMQDLIKAVAALDKDPSVRVIVLAGRGPAFSLGTDLNWLQQQSEAPLNDVLSDSKKLAQMLNQFADCSTPTIARVHGIANGIGAGLAAACHICVAATDASFAITDTQLGMSPTVIAPHLIRAIGERQCLRYFQTAERINALRAHEMGLAHEVAERRQLDLRLYDIIHALLQCDPMAQGAASKLVRNFSTQSTGQDAFFESLRQGAKLRGRPATRDRLGLQREMHLGIPFQTASRLYPLFDAK